MSMHMHDGHRERMRARIDKVGILPLEQHEVLEYMLYSFIPRKDTNELAHRLLKEYGTLYGVMHADKHALEAIPGMTENAALFLHVLPDIFHKYLYEYSAEKEKLQDRSTFENVQKRMGALLLGNPAESVCIAALDVHERLLAMDIISVGMRGEVRLDTRTVVAYAQKHKAHGIILGHNHPGGNSQPSTMDMSLTYEICSTLLSLGFNLLDHYIFNGQEVYSFKDHGHIDYFVDLHKITKEGAWIQKSKNVILNNKDIKN